MSKRCSNCLENKPFEEFHKQKSTKDGYQCHCKTCKKVLQVEYKLKKQTKIISLSEKICSDCNTLLSISNFNFNILSKDNHEKRCKSCQSIYNKKYRIENEEDLKIKKHDYYIKNQETIKSNVKEYAQKNAEKISKANHIYYINNKEKNRPKVAKYIRNKRNSDIFFKLKGNLRHRLNMALDSKKWNKNSKFSKYIGCDKNTLLLHLEKQFTAEMSWDNYAVYWQIDHIIPLGIAKTEDELYKLCHYANLKPLSIMEHKIKTKEDCKKIRISKCL